MLQLIQQATGEMGLAVPTYVAGNTNQDTVQQLALINAAGRELSRQYPWQALNKQGRKERVEMALRKVSKVQGGPVVLNDNKTKIRWPTLWAFLTQLHNDDDAKTPRKTATMTIFLRPDGALGAVLNDKDNVRNCFSAGTSLEELLDGLEAAAESDETEWRFDRDQQGSSKRIKNR